MKDNITEPVIAVTEAREEFLALIAQLKTVPLLGVDFEGEWNLHRYGLHLCLIQVSDGENSYLIDPLKVGDLQPFLDILEDPNVKIISHGPQSDIILMDYLFGAHPKNVFDTEKAAKLLGYENTSLSTLLEMKFGINKNMKVRVSNWNKRPLTEKMKAYALKDVDYLHRLHGFLVDELSEKGRLEWQEEENSMLEVIRYQAKVNPHADIKGANKLSAKALTILRHIYGIRDGIARSLDKPAYHIIPNDRLLDLAQNPPRSMKAWSELKGVNPRIRQYAQDFHEAAQTGIHSEIDPLPQSDFNRIRPEGLSKKNWYSLVDQRRDVLDKVKEKIQVNYPDIFPQILSSRNVKRVSYGEIPFEGLRKWQQKVILETAGQFEIDLSELMLF